jgi:hypothetical protein
MSDRQEAGKIDLRAPNIAEGSGISRYIARPLRCGCVDGRGITANLRDDHLEPMAP